MISSDRVPEPADATHHDPALPGLRPRSGGPELASRGVGVIFPVGMLGGGFSRETVKRGIELGADAIAVDGGSTDSGPYYLGTGMARTSEAAIRRDVQILLTAAREAGIPLIVTSCATAGIDAGVDWMAGIVESIARAERLTFTMATIYSEQSAASVLAALDAGQITALPPAGSLPASTVRRCTHIVGLMGHEPIAAALDAGADVVLAGRATDTASVAALALRRGLPAGPAWHAAKTVECGGLCTTDPRSGGVYVQVDRTGFTVEPLAPHASCTPATVAAHMLYENADPFRMREPSGTLDTSQATYTACDDRSVRVEGSQFEKASQATIKLEGSAVAGYETVSIVGIRDPHILADISTWLDILDGTINDHVQTLLGLDRSDYDTQLRAYGYNAVLGSLDPDLSTPREVGVLLKVRASDQATATAIAKIANPGLNHLPLPGMTHMPSFAFATSPAEIERGPVYEFVLNHTIDITSPDELFRTEFRQVTNA